MHRHAIRYATDETRCRVTSSPLQIFTLFKIGRSHKNRSININLRPGGRCMAASWESVTWWWLNLSTSTKHLFHFSEKKVSRAHEIINIRKILRNSRQSWSFPLPNKQQTSITICEKRDIIAHTLIFLLFFVYFVFPL